MDLPLLVFLVTSALKRRRLAYRPNAAIASWTMAR